MSAGINNCCLDCRRRNQLHCLNSLTKCHKQYARAYALWFAVNCDLLMRHNITYLTCGGSRFHVMTLIFDLTTFHVCSASAVTWPNHVPNFRKTEKSAAEFTGSILYAGLSSDILGKLTALSKTQCPNLNFSRLRRSLLGALTRLVPSALVATPLKLWAITASTANPKFKDRSRDSVTPPRFSAVGSTLRKVSAPNLKFLASAVAKIMKNLQNLKVGHVS